MKARIRAKLAQASIIKESPQPARTDVAFMDECVDEMIVGKSYAVKDVSKMVGMSEDWALNNVFKDAPGVFRCGKALRIPESALRARLRSMLAV